MDSKTLRISGNIDNLSSLLVVNNTDLLVQILLCLPVKSLLIFKSVSKQWLSLISDSHFIQNHCIHNPPKVSGLIMNQSSSSSSVIDPKYDFFIIDVNNGSFNDAPFETQGFMNDPFYPTEIVQSCNGLFLCCSSASYSDIGFRTYYVYNHSTKRYRIIPPPLYWGIRYLDSAPVSFSCISLAFDPLRSVDYKIVCIWRIGRVNVMNYKIEIYSSETSSWRLCGDTSSTPSNVLLFSGVYWKNCLNWICSRTGSLFYFDIDREELKSLPFCLIKSDTEMKFRYGHIKYFGERLGHLYFILMDKNLPNCFDIFEMEVGYNGWKLKYSVNLDGFANDYSQYDIADYDNFLCSILCVEEVDVDEVESKVYIYIPDKIISYYLKKKIFIDVCDHPFDVWKDFCSITWQHAHHYIESLANV